MTYNKFITALIKGVAQMLTITKENMELIFKSRLTFIANFNLYITINDLNLFLEHFPQIEYPEGVPFTDFENLFKAYGRTDIIKLIRMLGHLR